MSVAMLPTSTDSRSNKETPAMTIYTHIHHIIPRHMGGTDDPSNLVELTIEDHAIAHRVLYKIYGSEYDRLAWLGLSGRIGKEEIRRATHRAATVGRPPPNKGKKASPELRKRLSEIAKNLPQEVKNKRGNKKGCITHNRIEYHCIGCHKRGSPSRVKSHHNSCYKKWARSKRHGPTAMAGS